jgi:arginyl-tRNA--protein-N-Asp/Glu arginylyltransferase
MTLDQKLGFYSTPPHQCSYLDKQEAITLFADPNFPKNMRLYSALKNYGFRRSGSHLYIPKCENCSACISLRIPVNDFSPNRGQKRIFSKNSDLQIIERPATFTHAHFELYKKYLSARHPGGGMDNPTPESFMDFLTAKWSDTVFFEFLLDGNAVAIAVTDILDDSLSAVYTFYNPDMLQRSLGKFAILFQIVQAQLLEKKWLYLGYWIEDCKKMQYKSEFLPQELFYNGEWHSRS